MTTEEKTDNHRLDKWLWHARFFKTRSLATAAINGGKVHLNGERVKPAHRVRVGDRLSLSLQGVVGEFEVLGLPARRGPAAEASSHYSETAASAARRVVLKEQQRLANLSRPRSDSRPDKRERRQLMKLHRDQT
jgi:ribosome-associated heat shock protein Hsp15